jgi:uncharacterized protein with HEPN domain
MFNRTYELFLFDVFIAIIKIEKTVERFDNAQTLLYDYNAWDSVIREFEIIGEATNYLIKNNILDETSRVVVDFRNLLIHNYFGIDAEEVYDVVKSDLPNFKSLITDKLSQIDNDLKKDLIDAYMQSNSYLEFVKLSLEKLC